MGVVQGAYGYLGRIGGGLSSAPSQELRQGVGAPRPLCDQTGVEFDGVHIHVGRGYHHHKYSIEVARQVAVNLVRALRKQRVAERALTTEYGPRLAG
jgi:hypothetical protein